MIWNYRYCACNFFFAVPYLLASTYTGANNPANPRISNNNGVEMESIQIIIANIRIIETPIDANAQYFKRKFDFSR